MNATLLAVTHLKGPHVDFAALSPIIALLGGATIVLLAGLVGPRPLRLHGAPALALVVLGATLGLTIWQWHDSRSVVAGALRVDALTLVLSVVLVAGGICGVLLAWRSRAAEEAAHGEFYALVLGSLGGMLLLAAAQNTVALFLGFELLSIPLYVLCATELLKEHSLESGLKYLIVGSVGSATLLYGIAMIYGATGATDFAAIGSALGRHGLATDPLTLTGIALCVAGLSFKVSVAPFHQWTPDVYEGAPTPVTAFMAVTTKVAALGAFLRFFDVALLPAHGTWGPAVAVLAAVTIVVGNVGALGQSSLKRMLAYSSVAQAGYLLAGVVVATRLGVRATVFYLALYLLMNAAAFAVIVARERETGLGDSVVSMNGLGRERPLLAWPMTLAMLGLAGIPATAGFIGKFYLIDAAVNGGYTWLGVMIVIGSMISLGYYLPVVSAMWMRDSRARFGTGGFPEDLPALAGGSPELDEDGATQPDGGTGSRPEVPGRERRSGADRRAGAERRAPGRAAGFAHPEVALVAILGGAGTLFFGVVPEPVFQLVQHAGRALGVLL